MAKGRPRKPTKLHILDGTFRADRHGGSEPELSGGAAPCPRHLGKDTRKVWKQLVTALEGAGVLTSADQWTMERFCTAVVRLRVAEAKMDGLKMANADPVELALSLVQTKQLYVIVRGETETLKSLGAALGLSPAARTHLEVHAPTNKPTGIGSRDRTKGPPPPTRSGTA